MREKCKDDVGSVGQDITAPGCKKKKIRAEPGRMNRIWLREKSHKGEDIKEQRVSDNKQATLRSQRSTQMIRELTPD